MSNWVILIHHRQNPSMLLTLKKKLIKLNKAIMVVNLGSENMEKLKEIWNLEVFSSSPNEVFSGFWLTCSLVLQLKENVKWLIESRWWLPSSHKFGRIGESGKERSLMYWPRDRTSCQKRCYWNQNQYFPWNQQEEDGFYSRIYEMNHISLNEF